MAQVEILEVGPRDGLQNEPGVVPTATKIELIERMIAAGLRRIEVASQLRRVGPQPTGFRQSRRRRLR